MKKRIFIIALVAFHVASYAQWSQSIFNSPNQKLVEDAVKDGIVLVRQDYQLKDTLTQQRYGRNHGDSFGSQYYIAARVESGLCVSKWFRNPWENDDNYGYYRNSHYVPFVSKTSYRPVNDSNYTEISYQEGNMKALCESAILYIDSLLQSPQGFTVGSQSGEIDGWAIWAYSADSANIQAGEITLVTHKYSLALVDGQKKYTIKQPYISGSILGGIYVSPKVTNIGTVVFYFEGLITSAENDTWQLNIFRESTESNHSGNSDNLNGESNLTPIEEVEQPEESRRHRTRNRNR